MCTHYIVLAVGQVVSAKWSLPSRGRNITQGRLTDEQVSDRVSNYALKRIKLSKRLR